MAWSDRSFSARLRLVLLPLVLVAIPGSAVLAQGKPAAQPRLILKGHDPVAYFTVGRPVKGSPEFKVDWDGERYLFASRENRDKFAASPERYAPQFGGYCTGSMSRNVFNEADPEAWIVSDGRLYVFGQVKFAEMARKDPQYLATRIPLSAVNWKEREKK